MPGESGSCREPKSKKGAGSHSQRAGLSSSLGAGSAGCGEDAGVPSPSPRPYPRFLGAPRWGHLSRPGEMTEVLCGVNGASAKARREGSSGPWEPAARRREGRPLSAPRPRGAGRVPMATRVPGRAGWSGCRALPPPRGPSGLSTKGAPPRLLLSPSSSGIANASGDSVLRQDPHFLFLTVLCFQGRPGRSGAWSRAGMDQGQTRAAGTACVRRAWWGWHRRARVSPGLPTRPHPWPLSTPYCDSRGGGHTKIPHAVSTVSSPHVQTTPSSAPHWSSDWLHVPLKGRNL